MTILKCKMCGGDIIVNENQTYGTCDSCGSTMTLPRADSEQRVNLFNRANHFRRLNEFDKAMAVYESILNADDADAEAHWGVVLSRWGIEYVVDPATHRRIPTCHRVQTDPILSDADYLAALEHAPDSHTRSLYESEVKRIAEIQRDILTISRLEQPYDVFICYKETSDSGARTKDSTVAQDIYYQFTNAGHKTFFSRITLEDKLGQQYEPYIFAALNSARVMLVVGTYAENFNAVWVKNEWSRYLALMKRDKSRLMIPCYRDMDPYDLPEALSMLQSLDMGKIGFMQDLLCGVNKVLEVGKTPEEQHEHIRADAASSTATPIVASLLKRGQIFLGESNWEKAHEYFEKVLDLDPECSEAYWGEMLVYFKYRDSIEAVRNGTIIANNNNFQKAVKYASDDLKEIFSTTSDKCFESFVSDMVSNNTKEISGDLLCYDFVGPSHEITTLSSDMEIAFDNAVIIAYVSDIATIQDLLPALQKIAESSKDRLALEKLVALILCKSADSETIETLRINSEKGLFKSVIVCPEEQERYGQLFSDICNFCCEPIYSSKEQLEKFEIHNAPIKRVIISANQIRLEIVSETGEKRMQQKGKELLAPYAAANERLRDEMDQLGIFATKRKRELGQEIDKNTETMATIRREYGLPSVYESR